MHIGLIDSGVGGMSILAALVRAFPQHSFTYLSDQKNFPYSEKSVAELHSIGEENVEHLCSLGCEVIVIACNTLTVTTLTDLREKYPETRFIGTVPAVKPASEQLPPGALVMVLATKNTAESVYLHELVKPYQEKTNFLLVGTTALVAAIEHWDEAAIRNELTTLFTPQIKAKLSGLVLGCTHFAFIQHILQEYFTHPILFFEPSEGITKQLELLTNTPAYSRESSLSASKSLTFLSSLDRTKPSETVAAQFEFLQAKL